MNTIINESLKRAAEKIIHRPLRGQEETVLLTAFYTSRGTLPERVVEALVSATGVPRGLPERAAARSAGNAGIQKEINAIQDAWEHCA